MTAALAAGVGGLVFIAAKGTIGGRVADLDFGLYGVLMVLAAAQAWRHGYARRLEAHRAWALRLFALAIGSWLHHVDYGIWMLLTGGPGRRQGFTGPFDQVMAFFFSLPNLLVAELCLRARRSGVGRAPRWTASGVDGRLGRAAGRGHVLLHPALLGPGILAQLPG